MMEIYRAVIAARNNVSRAFNGPIAEMDGIMMLRNPFHVSLYGIIAFCRDIYVFKWIHFIQPGQKFDNIMIWATALVCFFALRRDYHPYNDYL